MDLLRRSIGRFGPMFLVIAMQGALLSGPSVATSQVVPESVLAKNINEPIGVAASPGRLLVTHPFCGNPREVLSISGTGKVSVFVTLPNRSPTEGNPGACFEDYLTIVPVRAGTDPENIQGFPTPNGAFRSNDIFVTQGQKILKIAFDGSSVSVFKTFSSSDCPDTQSGITFDNVGSFDHKLVVVCANGKVYTVDSAGTATLRGTISATGPFEGPVVAPSTFTPFEGCLLVAADHAPVGGGQPNGRVFPLCLSDPTAVASVPFAEGVTIIPTTKCTFALTPGDTYFTAIFGVGGNTIDQLPQSAFAGLGGRALVPSENNSGGESPPGITLLTPGESVTKSTFRPFFAQHQGSAFVDCHVPVLVRIQVIPQGGTLTLKIFGAANFDPALIMVSSLRFGATGTETPVGLNCVLPQKDDQESPTGAEHEHKGVATCTMVNNLPSGQPGILKTKFTDPANPGGDGDAEGGG